MKKILTLVLCMMFALVSVSAFADTAEWERYENTELGYSVEYPVDWLAMDAETVALLMMLAGDELTVGDYGADELSTMVGNSSMVGFYPLYESAANFSIDASNVGVNLPAELLCLMMCPELVEQIKVMMPYMKVVDDGYVVKVGDRNFCAVHFFYEDADVTLHSVQYYITANNMLYTITLTAPENELEQMQKIVMHALETLEF